MDILLDPFRFKPTRQIASGQYPAYVSDAGSIAANILSASLLQLYVDRAAVAAELRASSLITVVAYRGLLAVETIGPSAELRASSLVVVVAYRELATTELLGVAAELRAASLAGAGVTYTNWSPDQLTVAASPLGATLT